VMRRIRCYITLRTMDKPIEKDYKNWTDYAEAVIEYNKHLEQELKLYKKIMDKEVYPLTKFISENENVNLAAWGSSSCLVAIKYMKHLEEVVETVHWNACTASIKACQEEWKVGIKDWPPYPEINKVKRL